MSVIDDLVQIYSGSVPQDIVASQIGVDIAYTIATILSRAEEEQAVYIAGSHLGTATGLFLDAHAKDRGLRRQDGETDDQLRERLRTPPKAGTRSAILAAVQQIVGSAQVIMIELPRDGAYYDRGEDAAPAPSFNAKRAFFDRAARYGAGRGVVIVLIPESADAVESVSDALRTKVSAGKIWLIQEYT